MRRKLENEFPRFAAAFEKMEIEDIEDPLTGEEIADLESRLNVVLPPSYKRFLSCMQGFTAFSGSVQMSTEHPFFHEFESFDKLSKEQQNAISQKGQSWPPPSEGMLCFAEFFMDADGDQVLFDMDNRDSNGECAVYYYSHEDSPASIRKIADSFEEWINEFPYYECF